MHAPLACMALQQAFNAWLAFYGNNNHSTVSNQYVQYVYVILAGASCRSAGRAATTA